VPIIKTADVEFTPGSVPNTLRRLLVCPAGGSGAITLGELIMEPGAELPMHTHRIEESMVIVEGEATAILDNEIFNLKPRDVILVPAGEKHMLANRSNKPMSFLFFYPSVDVQLERV